MSVPEKIRSRLRAEIFFWDIDRDRSNASCVSSALCVPSAFAWRATLARLVATSISQPIARRRRRRVISSQALRPPRTTLTTRGACAFSRCVGEPPFVSCQRASVAFVRKRLKSSLFSCVLVRRAVDRTRRAGTRLCWRHRSHGRRRHRRHRCDIIVPPASSCCRLQVRHADSLPAHGRPIAR
jgi:hypothetical protein